MKFKFFLVLIMLNALCLLAMGQVNETTFGSSTADPTSLRGDIYYIPEGTASLPDSSSLTDLKWQGMNEDKVGEWDSGLPDGRNDGHFLLNLSLPRQIEIKSIAIYSADANGTHVGGQVWDTAATNYWILGVFYQGNQLDQHHVSSLGSFSGNVQFDLYGDDSGWFKSGNWFEVEVILGDGTKLTKLISISSNVDLTGVWSCDDGGTYYIRQSGDSIWWFGEPSASPGAWSNVANGTIRDSIINIFWSDVPKGCTMNKGTLVLSILSKDKLTATDKTGGFGGSNWARIAMNTCPGSNNTGQGPTTTGPGPTTTIPSTTTNPGSTIVTPGNQGALNPWDDTSVRPLIDEWIRQQDNCLKKVYGSGAFIDQWGRACGNLGNTSISCSLTPDHPADWDSYHYLWANNWCPMYYPYTVQSYVKYRQTGNSFDSMATCKGAGESCIA